MKYRVRNADGELEYESFHQLEEAAHLGFVEPDDEFLREGETEWKKVSTQPALLKHRGGPPTWRSPQLLWVYLALALGALAVSLLWSGQLLYGSLAIFPLVMVLLKVTQDASQLRRR